MLMTFKLNKNYSPVMSGMDKGSLRDRNQYENSNTMHVPGIKVHTIVYVQ